MIEFFSKLLPQQYSLKDESAFINALAKVPAFMHEEILNPPHTGAGVHQWLFTSALKLHKWLGPHEIFALLKGATSTCGRTVPDRELHDAILNSAALIGKDLGPMGRSTHYHCGTASRPWPRRDDHLIDSTPLVPDAEEQFYHQSISIPPGDADFVVQHLFPPDSLLCCASAHNHFNTLPLESWLGHLKSMQFLVANPMISPLGYKKDGTGLSAHTLANTGPRHYIVVEFDEGERSQQAGLHLHLAQFAPLKMVVFSGNKSLHGWYACKDQPEEKIRTFFELAVRLGADPATWTRSQFVRMPWGTRRSHSAPPTQQSVVYFR